MNRKKLIVGTLSVAMMTSLLSVSAVLADPGKECRNDMPKIKNKHCQSEPTKPPKDTPPPEPTQPPPPPIIINGVAYQSGGGNGECDQWIDFRVLQDGGWTPPMDVITFTVDLKTHHFSLLSWDGSSHGEGQALGVDFSSCRPLTYSVDGDPFNTIHGRVESDHILRFVPDGWVEGVQIVSKP